MVQHHCSSFNPTVYAVSPSTATIDRCDARGADVDIALSSSDEEAGADVTTLLLAAATAKLSLSGDEAVHGVVDRLADARPPPQAALATQVPPAPARLSAARAAARQQW